MDRIETVMFCNTASIEKQGTPEQTINCMGVVTQGAVPATPSLFSIAMVIIAEIISGPIANMKICVKSPENDTLFEHTMEINTDQLPQETRTDKLTVALNLQNLVIRSIGRHKFEFSINNQIDCEKYLNIIQKEF